MAIVITSFVTDYLVYTKNKFYDFSQIITEISN